jgi:hypothetical protein
MLANIRVLLVVWTVGKNCTIMEQNLTFLPIPVFALPSQFCAAQPLAIDYRRSAATFRLQL